MSDFPKRIKVEVMFDIGETVYVDTDVDQMKHTVMGYNIRLNEVLYDVYCHSSGEYLAYAFELTREKDLT